MTITKAHLTHSVQIRLGLPKMKSAELVDSLFETIKATLEEGEDILMTRFGKFSTKDKRDRRGRNPSTGEEMLLESRRVVTFKCSSVLKDKMNGKGHK